MTCALFLKGGQLSHSITVLPRDRRERNFSQDAVNVFDMDSSKNSVPWSEKPHNCSSRCLGPLTFHPQAKGQQIELSQGCRHAERVGNTFRNGLLFSSRPVGIHERIHLRVLKNLLKWEGGLRVGVTNLSPSDRNLPLPDMAIPNLTSSPGHWAAPLPESYCHAGSELEFWVSNGGKLCCIDKHNKRHKLLSGVDLSKPLWAMIDVYGQTSSIFLLGSEKKGRFGTSRSCPAPRPKSLTTPDNGHDYFDPDVSNHSGHKEDSISNLNVNFPAEKTCVVCCVREATVTLPCAHQCLCHRCFPKILVDFDTCPLCRHRITKPSVKA